ncbi:MAG TPA: hypothetical protein VLV50_09720 [Stellaceae bacterium]|nr:hypothetical protein [Stellaceae bacterium]
MVSPNFEEALQAGFESVADRICDDFSDVLSHPVLLALLANNCVDLAQLKGSIRQIATRLRGEGVCVRVGHA